MAFLHTFSIVARDETSGQIGVAVQTHWFAVGALSPWAEAGVGAIATQSMVEVSYGPLGLSLLREGKSANEAMQSLLEKDEGRELRQVAIVDAHGHVAVHTGVRCIREAGHQSGAGFSVQANMMMNDSVWPQMAEAFQSSRGELSQRMLAALKAAQAVGGDIRGQQSACMLVVGGERSDQPWKNTILNLRVDDAVEPIGELERLINIHQAYEWMNAGDELLIKNDSLAAREAYGKAAQLAPHIDEIPFWQAVTLADSGNLEEALPIFQKVFEHNSKWALLVQRLPAAGLLKDDIELMKLIQAQLQ